VRLYRAPVQHQRGSRRIWSATWRAADPVDGHRAPKSQSTFFFSPEQAVLIDDFLRFFLFFSPVAYRLVEAGCPAA